MPENPMKDPAAPSEGTQQADPLANLKAEFDRKLGNTQTELQKTNEMLKALLQQQQTRRPEPAKAQPPAISDDAELSTAWYSDEKKAAAIVKKQAVDEALQIISKRDEETQKRARVIQEIQSEFPETFDQSHPLVVKANEFYSSYSDEEKASPSAMKIAIKEAALELGIKPRSKRTDEDLSAFSFGGYSPSRPQQARQTEDKVSPQTLELARLMKVDVKKVEERAKSLKGGSNGR